MKLLIYSFEDDVHARAVAWAFRAHCGPCDILDYGDFPIRWQASAALSNRDDLTLSSRRPGEAGLLDHETYPVVWNRRAGPVGEAAGIAQEDAEIARTTSRRFLDQLRTMSWPGQIWVNPRESQIRADNKIYQLRLARQIGFSIPETLVSNDPGEIRAFVATHAPAVVKAIFPIYWSSETDPRSLPTSEVSLHHLAADLPVLACPMIYQRKTRKAFEIRVVVFGGDLLACRLNSQALEEGQVDFRLADPHRLAVEPFSLPADLVRKILAFMRAAGLLHGSLDFAVDEEGDFVFYEINEQGQSLWLEECNPEVRILDRLISFLSRPSPAFAWDGRERASIQDWPDDRPPPPADGRGSASPP